MRVILCLDTHRPWAELIAVATAAEAAGCDSVRLLDSGRAECWAAAGALACLIRVAIQVVVDDARGRHPAVVAKLASTVDRLSDGRLLLGLTPATDSDAEARLAEGFQVVKDLAEQHRTTSAGRFYRLQGAPLDPKPAQHPFPLMLVGGTATLAAAVADHWSIPGPAGDVAARLGELRKACAGAGRDPRRIRVSAPYPATGEVDGWVVEDRSLGTGRHERHEALTRIVTRARSAAR